MSVLVGWFKSRTEVPEEAREEVSVSEEALADRRDVGEMIGIHSGDSSVRLLHKGSVSSATSSAGGPGTRSHFRIDSRIPPRVISQYQIEPSSHKA